jgi:hypothetical protein
MTDKRLLSTARGFRDGILGRKPSKAMCFLVCWPLQTLLEAMGVESRLLETTVGRYNHTVLQLRDGRILDPTADQFDGPKVFLGTPAAWKREVKYARSTAKRRRDRAAADQAPGTGDGHGDGAAKRVATANPRGVHRRLAR